MQVSKQALFKKNSKNQPELIFNLKIWSLYLDFERNLGSIDSIKNAYKRCIDLKVASPFILITFANFLEENKFYEE